LVRKNHKLHPQSPNQRATKQRFNPRRNPTRGEPGQKTHPLPIEAIVRGYLIGSGWKDYQASGKICGLALISQLTKPCTHLNSFPLIFKQSSLFLVKKSINNQKTNVV